MGLSSRTLCSLKKANQEESEAILRAKLRFPTPFEERWRKKPRMWTTSIFPAIFRGAELHKLRKLIEINPISSTVNGLFPSKVRCSLCFLSTLSWLFSLIFALTHYLLALFFVEKIIGIMLEYCNISLSVRHESGDHLASKELLNKHLMEIR